MSFSELVKDYIDENGEDAAIHIIASLEIVHELGKRADMPDDAQTEWATGLLMSELQPLMSTQGKAFALNVVESAIRIMRKELPEGTRVHVDTQNDVWGRVAGEGTVLGYRGVGLLVEVDSIRASIIVPLNDFYEVE